MKKAGYQRCVDFRGEDIKNTPPPLFRGCFMRVFEVVFLTGESRGGHDFRSLYK